MQFELIAQTRTLQGTSASRRLRRASKVPGIVYGGEGVPQSIEVEHNDILLKLKKEAFHSTIINLVLDGKKSRFCCAIRKFTLTSRSFCTLTSSALMPPTNCT